jgi:DNA-binding Lrp family transcriptional regulator
MEKDPTISYKELAKLLNTTPQNIYYHYHKHIIGNRLIEGFNIAYRKFDPDTSLLIFFIFDFPNYTSFAKTTNAFRKLPIMHSLGKIIGENKLFATSYIPVTNARELFRTINNLVKIGIVRDYEYRIGYYKEYGMRETIAYRMFKDGEWLYPHEEYMNKLHEYYRKALAKIKN